MRSPTVTFLIPPFGICLGLMFPGETLPSAHAAGMLLIGAASGWRWKPSRPAVKPAAASS